MYKCEFIFAVSPYNQYINYYSTKNWLYVKLTKEIKDLPSGAIGQYSLWHSVDEDTLHSTIHETIKVDKP